MFRLRILICSFFVVVSWVNLCLAQGTLQANLDGHDTNGLPVTGQALLLLPTIADGDAGPFFPITFEVNVSSAQVFFTAGRIFGPGMAWAFELGMPIYQENSTSFGGSTGMVQFQIDDMLAGVTSFELDDGVGVSDYMVGPIMPVPEPDGAPLLFSGLIIFNIVGMLRMFQDRNPTK